ncbi:FAD/NAD(P)-binding domain-containing protein [Dothidotthia symphoricarpi CBS 119687]|uniref:FAD/NAD(P)-binding domain-containing protein n=1 Tax=Dothidotthia symphoricarpi CBS 119687 TaxID=1392245 RepID=A0A6A6A7K9_9PLEO|nr:FAD/NAD(P)-binding domain-containing protein [Dothidotthia symphoricarpi CBS 119687]KAF2126778.1 FAD/NAD(P)-binding domain-containing protein [Dothidotthia symphoricarpi CBS 119687]
MMGNIGNLNMDHKAHVSENRTSPKPISPSRIHKDLPGSPHQETQASSMIRRAAGKAPHVCVVGAGVAGLRCADVLLQHGMRVTILEGRDRVGGRLCQSSALGHMVDLGPNWIHGTDNNPILDLAKQTNTVIMNWDGRQSVFDHLGKQMPDKEATETSEVVWGIIEQAMKLSNEESAKIPAEKSLYAYFEEQVVEMFPGDKEKGKRTAVLQMAEMWGAFVGSPVQRQSLKFLWLEECIDGENLFVAGTYHKILQKIAQPALKKAAVMFGHKVTRIVSSEQAEDPKLTVELEGRESQIFDEVVMTAPLGWLKRNTDAFVPALPERLQEGIKAIGYGNLDKVYITFPTAFWNDSTTNTTTTATTSNTTPNVPATAAPLRPSAAVNPSHYPGFTHFLAPHYTPTNPSHWNQEAMNLAALPPPTAHPTLLFYIHGPTSLHIASLLRTSPASKHDALLTSFFEPYYSLLPSYSASNPDHQPKAILATAWANDELAGYGSYANFPVGLERGDEDIEAMRRGVPEKGLWFAGEHTAPFVALGTVTGAWWSGESVAKQIAGAYGLEGDLDVVAR